MPWFPTRYSQVTRPTEMMANATQPAFGLNTKGTFDLTCILTLLDLGE